MFQRCDWVSNTPASARPSTIPQSLSRCEYLALTRELTEPCPDRTLQRKGTQYFTPRFAKDESRRRGRLQTSETCAGLQVLQFKAFESPLHFSDRSEKSEVPRPQNRCG